MNFIVIGGDAAGMSAASRAKRNMPDLNVTVLEKTMDVSYSACGMPYNIADPDREINELVVRKAEVFKEKQGINLLTGHRADVIDPVKKIVSGTFLENKEFQLPFDSLLIATGAESIVPDLPGFDLPGVMVLKNLEHGRKIKEFLKANSVEKVVIIGMGYIALEMCEALRTLKINVDMIKPRPRFLPWMDEKMAESVRKEVESHGADLYPGHEVEKIEKSRDGSGGLTVVCSELRLDCDMVLVSIGVTPNSEIAAKAGIKLGAKNAISVDSAMETSKKNIFAAGDCADAVNDVTGEKTWIPLALRANRAGWAVADTVCGKETKLPGIVGTAVFKVFDLQIARTGLNASEALKAGFSPVEVMVETRSRAHAHPGSTTIMVYMVGDKGSGRLLGVQMVGKEGTAHRINAPAVALHSNMTVEEFSRTDLAYAPPFGPTWDPMLTAANQLVKKL